MTLDDVAIDLYARLAAKQMIVQYVPQAKSFGFNLEDIKKLIRKTADHAIEILNKQPA